MAVPCVFYFNKKALIQAEKEVAMKYCIGFGFVFLFFGILIFAGKAECLFPELKQASKSCGKRQYMRLCRNIGSVIAVCSVILFMGGFWQAFFDKAFLICMIVWGALCIADIVFIVKSRCYKSDRE